ncbi:hypothetical protein AB0M20_42100 [Actinoplanes sp. NPDC051633]|uniref:hypothetical protein n=1 Tax=Actinoplanes sp. NPDC051633 TaxID=3155670 RepID=UPI00342F53BF
MVAQPRVAGSDAWLGYQYSRASGLGGRRLGHPVTGKPSVAPVLNREFTRMGLWRFSRTTVALYIRG